MTGFIHIVIPLVVMTKTVTITTLYLISHVFLLVFLNHNNNKTILYKSYLSSEI